MADLTTTAAVKAQLSINGTLDDTLIDLYVTQASQWVESYCKRQFSDTLGTLTLDACPPDQFGRRLYFGQDVLGVYEVVNAGTTLTASQYRLLPPNDPPYYAIELLPSSGLTWTYTNDPQGAVTVAGTLGYCTSATRPADVTLAATKLATWLYQNRDNNDQMVRFADGSVEIPSSAPAMIRQILDQGRYVKDRLYA